MEGRLLRGGEGEGGEGEGGGGVPKRDGEGGEETNDRGWVRKQLV